MSVEQKKEFSQKPTPIFSLRLSPPLAMVLALFLLLPSCSYQKEKVAKKSGNSAQRAYSKELLATVSFALVKTKVLEPYKCIDCHLDTRNEDYSDYAFVLTKLANIEKEVLVLKTMPKKGPALTAEDAEILGAWLATKGRQFPENGTGVIDPPITPPDNPPNLPNNPPNLPDNPPNPPDNPPNLPDNPPNLPDNPPNPPDNPPNLPMGKVPERVLKIFQDARCFECHLPGGGGEAIELDSLRALLDPNAERRLVIAFDPENSILLKSVLPTAQLPEVKPMPPLRRRPAFRPLTEEEIQVIRDWIKEGAVGE